MKCNMLWDPSVHNMSLPFDHTSCLGKSELETCLRFPVSENRNRKLRSGVVSFSFLFFQLFPTPRPSTQAAHQLHLEIHQLVRWPYQLVPHLDSAFSLDLRAHWSAVSVSRLLTILRKTMISIVHIVGLCGFYFSIQVEIENVVFETDWNEFILSIPVHQFLKMNPRFLTIFTVNTNHISTVMSEVEILSSFARDFCRTTQNFVNTNESSIQRSEQSVSVVSLELSSYTIRNPFTTGSTMESSISCSFWAKVQNECVHCSPVSRFIFTHSNRFGLLVALTSKPPSEHEFAEV